MKFISKTALGIDVSNGWINMTLLKKTDKGIELTRTASTVVPQGVIKNGNIKDPAALAKAVKELRSRNKMAAGYTAISFVADPILLQILDMPPEMPQNITKFVQNEVKHYAVLPMRNVAVDFCRIKKYKTTGPERILVVAADGKCLDQMAQKFHNAGLNINNISPAIFAYFKAFDEKIIQQAAASNLLFAVINENEIILALFRKKRLDFLKTKRLDPRQHDSDETLEMLTEEVNAIKQFYELELQNSDADWKMVLFTSTNNPDFNTKAHAITEKLSNIELTVETPEEAYRDTPIIQTNYAERPSSVAIGLAMKALDTNNSDFNINLIPEKLTRKNVLRKQALIITNIAAVIVIMIFLFVAMLGTQKRKLNEQITQKKKIQSANNTRALLTAQNKINEKIKEISMQRQQIKKLLDSSCSVKWGNVLSDIAQATPQAIQITKLTAAGDSDLTIQGISLSYQSAGKFVETLNSCDNFASAALTKGKMDTKSAGLFRYSIKCSLVR